MSVATSPTATSPTRMLPAPPAPLHHRPTRDRREQTLELEIVAGGDPVRLAHMLATMVESSPMALATVAVSEQSAHPAPATVVTRRRPMRLTLRMRGTDRQLDGPLVEEVATLVSTMCTVVERRRLP